MICEAVEDLDGVGQMSQHGTDKAGDRSVATASMCTFWRLSRGPERLQGFGAFALAHKDHRSTLQVQDYGQIAVPFADADLVDGDLPELMQLGTENVSSGLCP